MNVCQYYGSQQERAYIQDDISRQRRKANGGKWTKDNYNIVLTTYQMATRKEDSNFLRKFQFSYMILDEAQNIKNQGSMRYKNLFRQKTRHRILLTGTPLQNNLDELWALLQFLMPQLFATMDFKPISSQLARLKRATPQAGKRVEGKYVHRMKRCLQPFILRRLKMQIGLLLKPKTIDVSKCSLTEEQRAVYHQIFNRSRVAFLKQQSGENPGVVSMANFLQNVLMQLRKTANHPVLVRAFYTEDQIYEIAKRLKVKNDDWRADPLEHVVEDLQAYSDFQIHTLAKSFSYLSEFKLSNDQLFNTSGKFLALSELLPQLIHDGHRVLLFSQMTRMLGSRIVH
jgi:SWI/SNF-related matrix-associated actin-dependent regulator of chromatin subfamily A containing DEAD/H box 1